MSNPARQSFHYHASALGLGGVITRPFSEVLEAQAATSLPSTGGYASARAENYRYRDLISFDRAYSVVTGSVGERTNDTVATVAVEGLNIMNVVTADRVVGRLTSNHGTATQPTAASLLPVGSYFVNLRIAGVEVKLRSRDLLQCRGKRSELEHVYRTERSLFLDPDGKPFPRPETEVASVIPQAATQPAAAHRPLDNDYLRTSIFHRPDDFFPGVTNPPIEIDDGGAIHIDGFGRIILGQYIITRDSRHLTMIVCHLGCAVKATVEVDLLQGNGIPG